MILSTPLHAKDNIFHFCGAKVNAQKKYYVTELFPGKIQIVITQELRKHLMQKYTLDADLSVQCHSYGSDASPAEYKLAEKLRKLEIQKIGFNKKIELLDWMPAEQD